VIVATAVACIAVFVVALRISGVVGASAGVLTTTQQAVAIMRDGSIDDAAREKAIQRASIGLIASFGSILLRAALALAASLLPVWLAGMADLARPRDVFEFLSRRDVILAATGVMIVGYVARVRLWPSN
jgi:hypothetical protein